MERQDAGTGVDAGAATDDLRQGPRPDVYSGVVENLQVVPATPELLAALEMAMPSQHHGERYRAQLDGDGVYLVALLRGSPVGRVLLRWRSTNETLIGLGIAEPHVEALAVMPDSRSLGIGTALMQSAEHAVLERGGNSIGLHVGVNNPRALSLYHRLGYEEVGLPPLEITWSNRDDSGQDRVECEVCTYLAKRLVQ